MYWVDIHDNPLYMMFPVWFFTFKYNGKPYTILVNGQTGKVVGTMPWVTKRITAVAVCTFVLMMAIFSFLIVGAFNDAMTFSGIYRQLFCVFFVFGSGLFARSVVGLKKIKKNLRLTQSEDIFKFVKKRQE